MHELSIAQALIGIVKPHIPAGTKLRMVTIESGPMRGIEPLAMEWAWESATPGTICEGSKLELRTLPWKLRCPRCELEFTAEDVFAPCRCGYDRPAPMGGDELRLLSIDVDDQK